MKKNNIILILTFIFIIVLEIGITGFFLGTSHPIKNIKIYGEDVKLTHNNYVYQLNMKSGTLKDQGEGCDYPYFYETKGIFKLFEPKIIDSGYAVNNEYHSYFFITFDYGILGIYKYYFDIWFEKSPNIDAVCEVR